MQFKYLPNILSFSRIVITPLFILAMLKNTFYYKIFSFFVFSIASLSDFFDGYLARKYNNISKLGKYIDPLADKILMFSGFCILYSYYPEVVQLWMLITIFLRDFFVMILRNYLIINRKTLETSSIAKIKTILQILVIHIFLLFHIFYPELINSIYFYFLMQFIIAVTLISTLPYFRFIKINDNR
tara:strand:- start:321 stop:875 length:555 start_codon:yes stop_codon:yes gene_type:complete